ncbi:hypothetical protein CDL12_03535 [Handroanthus impetiginosus]|uniref:Uncharacterized protein n=1 Tax=Handroanthus impetiginosus TaxID=429701 RepID=A0A2G9I1V6_9LAMI|nr:hypothetical protein CDL12_03535 [Handroanthus impetiginosus]
MKYIKPMKLFQELLKSNELKKGRLLGLNVGDERVTLTVSDANNKSAAPLSVVVPKKKNVHSMALSSAILS